MPGPYPREFREDVVVVAHSRDGGVTIKQIATGFGISQATLQNWLCRRSRRKRTVSVRMRQMRERKKWIRLLKQDNKALCCAAAYLSQANLRLDGSPDNVPARCGAR